MHVTIRVGRAAVGEQDQHLMDGLGHVGEEIPEGVLVLEVGLRVALLRVDEVGE